MGLVTQRPGRVEGVHVSRRTGFVYHYAVTYSQHGAVILWKANLTLNAARCGKLRGEIVGLGGDRDAGLFIAVAHVEPAIDRGLFEAQPPV